MMTFLVTGTATRPCPPSAPVGLYWIKTGALQSRLLLMSLAFLTLFLLSAPPASAQSSYPGGGYPGGSGYPGGGGGYPGSSGSWVPDPSAYVGTDGRVYLEPPFKAPEIPTPTPSPAVLRPGGSALMDPTSTTPAPAPWIMATQA